MRIEQLEYVATVARLGSFRRAADELHISQPALSGSVRSLERELGVDLLDRGRHGARMSDSGRELFPIQSDDTAGRYGVAGLDKHTVIDHALVVGDGRTRREHVHLNRDRW